MIVALALVPVLRLNPAATYLGSAIVNPITGPFVYYFDLWLGLTLLGRPQLSWAQLSVLDGAGWWHLFVELIGPFLAGGVVLAPIGGALSYVLVHYAVGRWRARVRPKARPRGSESDREKTLSSAKNERGSAGAENGER